MSTKNNIVIIRNIFVIAFLGLFSTNLHAQGALATGYFTDGYIYKHKLNPALTPTRGYISFPFLTANISLNSNLAPKDFIYPDLLTPDGKMMTFLSEGVPVSRALSGIQDVNQIKFGLDEQILSVGFFNFKGTIFTTIEADIRANLGLTIPKGLFEFAKASQPSGKYDLSGFSVNLSTFTQLAVGQSFKIGEKVKLGYKLKWLTSTAMLGAETEKFDLLMGYNDNTSGTMVWKTDVVGKGYGQNLRFGTEGSGSIIDFSDITNNSIPNVLKNTFSNVGFGVDLGLTWDILSWLQVSASATDFGAVFYRNMSQMTMKSKLAISNNGAIDASSFEDLLAFEDGGVKEREAVMLPSQARAGLQIRIPKYEKISFGALYTQNFQKLGAIDCGWWEARASFNYDIARCFAMSLSYAYGKFGHQAGALLSLHANGFNLFFGVDNVPFQWTNLGIPMDSVNVAAHFGLGFHFGKYQGRYPKKISTKKISNK